MDLKRLKEIAYQASQQNGCRFYDFYKHRDRLQFFVDKPHEIISLKDCENIFHSLRFLIRSEFPEVLDQKRLEVSSPGLEKRLREPWHFREALGKKIKIISTTPIQSLAGEGENQKKLSSNSITGELTSADEKELILKQGYWQWHIPLLKIKSAQMVFLLSNEKKTIKKKAVKKKAKALKKIKKQKT